MTLYNMEGQEQEKISLAEYDDKDRLNQLMVERGFRKRTEEELEFLVVEKKRQKEYEKANAEKLRIERMEKNIATMKANNRDPTQIQLHERQLEELKVQQLKVNYNAARADALKEEAQKVAEEGGDPDVVRVIDKHGRGMEL